MWVVVVVEEATHTQPEYSFLFVLKTNLCKEGMGCVLMHAEDTEKAREAEENDNQD